MNIAESVVYTHEIARTRLQLNDQIFHLYKRIGCSFKFPVKVGVEESIVNAPQITDHESAVYNLTFCSVCVFNLQTDEFINRLFNTNSDGRFLTKNVD
jgi:hypothetical protein